MMDPERLAELARIGAARREVRQQVGDPALAIAQLQRDVADLNKAVLELAEVLQEIISVFPGGGPT